MAGLTATADVVGEEIAACADPQHNATTAATSSRNPLDRINIDVSEALEPIPHSPRAAPTS
jgi:hypothetical protein